MSSPRQIEFRRAAGWLVTGNGAARGAGTTSWVASTWAGSRLLMLLILIPSANIFGDVNYYARQVQAIGSGGIGDVLREYPAPAFAVFLPAWWAAFGHRVAFLVTFLLLMIAIDGLFTAALWRAAGRQPAPGLRLWLLLGPCLGPLLFTRFDLTSAALAGAALLAWSAGRSGRAGVLAGAGAAVKLWPAVLLPVLLIRAEPVGGARDVADAAGTTGTAPAGAAGISRGGGTAGSGGQRRAAAGFLAVVAIAAAATVAVAGVGRLMSPLTWQGERGLQIESPFALPLLWARLFRPATWSTPYTKFYAFQVEGPGADFLARLSTVATVAALVGLGWLWWRALRRPQPAASVVPLAGTLMIGAAALLVITNKTLSPQYLPWIGGLLAALGCLAPAEPTVARANRLLLLACLVTQVLYPLGYHSLTHTSWLNWLGVPLLTTRDALLVALTAVMLGRVVALTRTAPAPRAAGRAVDPAPLARPPRAPAALRSAAAEPAEP